MFTRVCMGREIELLTWSPLVLLSSSKCFFSEFVAFLSSYNSTICRQLPTPPIYRAALLQACESDPFCTEVLSPTLCSVLRSTFSNFPYRRGSLPGPESFFSSLFSPGERNKAENCEKKYYSILIQLFTWTPVVVLSRSEWFSGGFVGFPSSYNSTVCSLFEHFTKVESRAGCLTKSGHKLLSRSLVASKFQIA